MVKLNHKQREAITSWANTVQDGDLYKALHSVGDDPIKSLIEDILRRELTDDVFRKVVAIFKLATDESDSNPWND